MKRSILLIVICFFCVSLIGCQAEDGIKKLQQEVWKNPKDVKALFKLGAAYGSRENFKDAGKTFEKLVEIDSTNDLAFSALGASYFKLGEYENAANAFKKAVSLDSTDADYQNDLANTYLKLEKYQKALNTYQTVLALDSTQTDTYYNIGLCYGYLGDTTKTRQILEKLEVVNNYLSTSLKQKLLQLSQENISTQN